MHLTQETIFSNEFDLFEKLRLLFLPLSTYTNEEGSRVRMASR